MGPTPRDWLGAGLLVLVLVVLIVILVTGAMGGSDATETAVRAFV